MKEMVSVVISDPQAKLLNVLLVEDNVIDARLISGYLKGPSEGLKCKHVNALGDALQLLKSVQFDVILLDLNLEDSAGYETFSRIRPAASKAAIVVLSGSDDEELAIRTVREGAQDYLVKGSFDRRLLLRAIRYAYERKQSEEALRQSEATVRAIFENSQDGILIFGDQGHCIEGNSAAAALLGLTREELLGASLFELSDPEFESEWLRVRNAGKGRIRFSIRRKDGAKRLVDGSFNIGILPARHLGVLRDITEQQSLEEQLRQSQKMEAVGRLAGGVAHDFNNILGIISGYAELLQLNATDAPQRSRADRILNATEKAASLTKQLLAFGRRQVMSPKLLDLASVVAEVNSMVHCLVGAESQVIIRAMEDVGMVNADQGQLEQVILNLAANARDAMSNGGVLTIGIKNYVSKGSSSSEVPAGEYVLLSVSDTGTGMDPDVQSRIFEPFFTTKKSGSGLGLSTVYGIVRQSGGHITVHSEAQVGSTFNIYLPMVANTRVRPIHTEEQQRIDLEGHETILLVDDEDDLRNAAAEYLETCGYRVLKAGNGKEAIEISDDFKGRISLLISDIVMPKVNGRGLVDHVRKTRPETSILVISGYADDAVIRHGIFLETTCFLQKPFTFQVLGAKIRTLLDHHC
ncbi:MAG TPA: response regulator [Candidatus Angelobacter sp.]|nr:response regulator [Candidatus Angelobacter sp.]